MVDSSTCLKNYMCDGKAQLSTQASHAKCPLATPNDDQCI